MAGSPRTLKNALEEWLDQNYSSGYTSCIKIHGRPILPPLMSEERRIEMRHIRDIAVAVENRLSRKKGSNIEEDSAGGEAMYEGVVDELHFANTLPNSLAANLEETVQRTTSTDLSLQHQENLEFNQAPFVLTTSDMLKEFDPLAEENQVKSVISPADHLLDFNCDKTSERIPRSSEKTVSKPSSAESSVALSYSTDLNNYMDITEGSVDVSIPCSDVRSTSGAGVMTPSTIRPDSSSSSKSHLSVPWRDGKTTYEDLNNYLDSLLNNSGAVKKQRHIKDRNRNVLSISSSSQSSQRTVSPLNLPEVAKQHNSSPPPLTSPQGSLQTRIMTDNHHFVSTTPTNVERTENTSNFLQSCALSPVVQSGIQNSYDEKVQLYLQNLMLNEGMMELPQKSSSSHPQQVAINFKETVPSKDMVRGEASQMNADPNFNGFVQAPPRLVRSNSYTLESPSPMLLAHMEAELRKNVRNEPIAQDKPPLPQSVVPSRRVWDIETSKNMPSWCNRQSNASNANVNTQSPKKVLNRSVSAQSSVPGNLERRGPPPDAAQKSLKDTAVTKCSPDQPKQKSVIGSHQKEMTDKQIENNVQVSMPSVDDSDEKVRTLLSQLQLQHKQEMEELLNRQRKEAEAIRLALLEERRASPSLITGNIPSPPSKDEVLMERRNTSPSLYEKENSKELQTNPTNPVNQSSSVSLDDVRTGSVLLMDTGKEQRALKDEVLLFKKVSDGAPRVHSLNAAGFGEYQPGPPKSYSSSSDMVTSFPPSRPSGHHQPGSMTSSLPAEILSLHLSNTELTFTNAKSVSCTAQSSVMSFSKPVSVATDITSVAQNILKSAFGSSETGGPQSKRRSWCSRQLFPDDYLCSHPDWVTQFQEIQKHEAAAKIQAGVRGYLTRRLLKTERVQNCITTIRDTIVCALQLQRECAPHVEPSDLQLHGRLIQQLSAACEDLHNIFMGLPVHKRMAIIASDRERLRIRTPRSESSVSSRPLSRATQMVLQRRMNQTDSTESSGVYSKASLTSRSRRRSWATVESRVRASPLPINVAYNCEVIPGCLSRSSAPTSLPLQRSASAGSSRKPWR